MRSIFREYDIRGIFEKELTETSVKLIGYHLGNVIRSKGGCSVALGYDARTHSPILKGWLASGFNEASIKVYDMGLVATPVNYYSGYCEIEGVRPDGTVMITGSHNPPEYNGFKIAIQNAPFFGEAIYALGERIEADMERQITSPDTTFKVDIKSRYCDYLVEQFSHLKGMDGTYVFDCGNGVAGVVLEPILKALEIDAKLLYETPDGTFPNHHPDPSEEENLVDVKKVLLKEGCLFGFAYDGDADRIALLDAHYNYKGDVLALFFAQKMENPTVIGEVKCSQIMYDEINKRGHAIMYKTGHSNLKVKIKETNADLAAEVSGHLFFNDRYFGYDDAIYATLRALELIHEGFAFKDHYEALPSLYSTDEMKIKTTEEQKFQIIERIKSRLNTLPESFPKIREVIEIDGVRVIFEEGWGLVRASNTTPVLVTRFEAQSKSALHTIQSAMGSLIEECL